MKHGRLLWLGPLIFAAACSGTATEGRTTVTNESGGAATTGDDAPAEWECGLRAWGYQAGAMCFEQETTLGEVCSRQLYPDHPSASIGPVCVQSPDGSVYVAPAGASVELTAEEGWEVPALDRSSGRSYEHFRDSELCRAALAVASPSLSPEPSCD